MLGSALDDSNILDPQPNSKSLINNGSNGKANKLDPQDRPVHDWYRFVLSFPPHLVRYYINKFQLTTKSTVLDPFCGTGTVIVEAQKQGLKGIGIEANPVAYFASKVKTNWSVEPKELMIHAELIAKKALSILEEQGVEDIPFFTQPHPDISLKTLPEELNKLLLKNSISPLPLHKALVLIECINDSYDARFTEYEKLALAKSLVYSISNLHFGPEVGIGKIKNDTPVIAVWLECIKGLVKDLTIVNNSPHTTADIYDADARDIAHILKHNSIDAVITSPPYPNEKDYTRTTRLELVLLGFINNKSELQKIKKNLIRSNTRGVYKEDDDEKWVRNNVEVQRIANEIEKRRIALGKTSGFEKLYHKVTKLYFGGMAKHFAELRNVLKPGSQLAYVVGDQASYLRIMIRTGNILADIAKELGYEIVDIELFRTRLATATKEQLREEVLLLKWNG